MTERRWQLGVNKGGEECTPRSDKWTTLLTLHLIGALDLESNN